MTLWPPEILIFITTTFLFAGFVKGVIGLGFPTIVIALLAVPIGLQDAMGLMLLPCFLTNFWQASTGGYFLQIVKRFWLLFGIAIATIWMTTGFLDRIENQWLLGLLGLIVCTYGVLGILTPKLTTPPWLEPWLTPSVGVVNGILTGLTGTFVVPGVLYFQSLKLQRDSLIQAMGLLFLLSTLSLGIGLWENRLVSANLGFASLAALLPSFLGMHLGQLLRKTLSEQSFRRIFYVSLMGLGLYILWQSAPHTW